MPVHPINPCSGVKVRGLSRVDVPGPPLRHFLSNSYPELYFRPWLRGNGHGWFFEEKVAQAVKKGELLQSPEAIWFRS